MNPFWTSKARKMQLNELFILWGLRFIFIGNWQIAVRMWLVWGDENNEVAEDSQDIVVKFWNDQNKQISFICSNICFAWNMLSQLFEGDELCWTTFLYGNILKKTIWSTGWKYKFYCILFRKVRHVFVSKRDTMSMSSHFFHFSYDLSRVT